MKLKIEVEIKMGRVTMNGKTYADLSNTEKIFMNDLLRNLKLESESINQYYENN